ncbi:MAG: hypothetical protein HUU57_01475 [Bdellovibrio sp.]|nr:hypothetical protein [Bdellovibrio sp.]
MNIRSRQRGQGSVEGVLALPLIFCFITALGALVYRGTVYCFADYHLHEALICLDSASVYECEQELSARLKKVLLFKEQTELFLRKGTSQFSGKIAIDFSSPPKMHLRQIRERLL